MVGREAGVEIAVVVHVRARPGAERALRDALVALVAPTRREAGCLAYDLVSDLADPAAFAFVERWRDAAALEAHLAAPHVAACLAAAGPLLAGPPDARRFAPVA